MTGFDIEDEKKDKIEIFRKIRELRENARNKQNVFINSLRCILRENQKHFFIQK